jgi:hypothetical protein
MNMSYTLPTRLWRACEGTYSHGSLRDPDVVAGIVAALDAVAERVIAMPGADDPSGPVRATYLRLQARAAGGERLLRAMANEPDADPSEAVSDYFDDADTLVGELSGGTHYLGMHPGDGSDLGIWPGDD